MNITILDDNGVTVAHAELGRRNRIDKSQYVKGHIPLGKYWNGSELVDTLPPPQTVTRRQGRQALLLAGLLDQVQPAIDAIADATERGMAQIYWDDAQSFERQNTTLLALATALGLDDSQVDDIFVQAAQL